MREKNKIRKENFNSTLPLLKVVYKNHRLIAAYCEGKVAEELLKLNSRDAVLISVGTSRQDVDQVAATKLKIGDKIRAFISVKIVKGTRNNCANAIIYMLQSLGTSSSKDW